MRTSWLILHCLVSQYPSLCQFHLSEQCLAVPAPSLPDHFASYFLSNLTIRWWVIERVHWNNSILLRAASNFRLQLLSTKHPRSVLHHSVSDRFKNIRNTTISPSDHTSSHSPLAEWSLSKTCSLQLSSCAAAAVLQRCQVQTLLGGISRY